MSVNYSSAGDDQGSTSGNGVGNNAESFASAFEGLIDDHMNTIRPGNIVEGTIVDLGKDFVRIDIGFKTEGICPVVQFQNHEGKLEFSLGDTVQVYIVYLENDYGQLVLSRERAQQKQIWDQVESIFEKSGSVKGRVVQKVKGGLQVDIGIPAFLPGSQVDIRPHRNLDRFLGEEYDFKILKITKDKGNIVLSRRALLVSERDQLRSETLKVLTEGVVMEGIVKNITDYGAFIDLGGIDGLLHITDISWSRVNHPSERLTVGQTVPVVVLKYDAERERVSLGMKQLKEDPWIHVEQRYPAGSRISGRVINLAEYGAFVELEEGVEGLIHVSEMTWSKKVRNPNEVVSENDIVEAVVLGVDAEQRRVSLGMKQLLSNPWEALLEKHPIGSRVKGTVRSIKDFGMFVSIDDGIDGLVHLSDFSWTKRLKDPKEISELYKKGDEVEAQVLDVDVDSERLSLGIKQLESDPWDALVQRYPVGSKVNGTVSSHPEFGIFVEIEPGIEGLVHTSQLGLSRDDDVATAFPVGSKVDAEVMNVDRDERKISLSIRSIKDRDAANDRGGFMQESGSPVTFGDLLRQKIDGND
jgi:small subunit ribosomal protein S1